MVDSHNFLVPGLKSVYPKSASRWCRGREILEMGLKVDVKVMDILKSVDSCSVTFNIENA